MDVAGIVRTRQHIVGRAFLALGLAVVVIAPADAADTPIYKCRDANGEVLYTDNPCKGGERLDIQAGTPDPAASKRLERAQEALDKGAAEHRAAEERQAARQAELDRMRREAEEAQRAAERAANNQYYVYALGWGCCPPFTRHRPPRPRPPKPPEPPRFAPNPP